MAGKQRTYSHPTQEDVDVPPLDLLTFLFYSDLSVATDNAVLHFEAASPANKIRKVRLRELIKQIAHGLRHNFGISASGPNKDVITVISYVDILASAILHGIVAAGGVYSAASTSSTLSELSRKVEIWNSKLPICGHEHKDLSEQKAKVARMSLENVLVPSAGHEQLRGRVVLIEELRKNAVGRC